MPSLLTPGIAQRIVREDSAYELIAIIEGASANKQFITNLQVVGQQRRLLNEATAQLQRLPKTAKPEERAQLTKAIADIDARLTLNMQFMTKNYGYSVQNNYLLVPVLSALLKKGVDENGQPSEDEAKAAFVTEFSSPEAYDELQALRQRAAVLGADAAKKEEFEAVKTQLNEKFGFEVGQHYILQVRKGALYATVKA